MNFRLILCLFVLGSLQLNGQVFSYGGYQTFISESFNIGSANLNDLEQDWNGFIWMATDDGLYRFDGTIVKRFGHSLQDTSLPHNLVFDIFVDQKRSCLWLGTSNGLCRLDPATGQSVHYKSKFEDPNSIADNVVRYVFEDRNGRLWVGCYNHGLSRYRPETDDFQNYRYTVPGIDSIQNLFPNINESRLNSFKFIVQDQLRDEILWLASPHGLLEFNVDTRAFHWKYLNSRDANADYLMKSVNYIYPLEGKLLIGTHGIPYFYEIATGSASPVESSSMDIYKLNYSNKIIQTSPNNFLISYRNGMLEYNGRKNLVESIWEDQPELNKHYAVRYIDSEGRAWVHGSGRTILFDPSKQLADHYLLDPENENPPSAIRVVNQQELVLLNSEPDSYHVFDLDNKSWNSFSMKGNNIDWDEISWRDLVILDDQHWILISSNKVFKLNTKNNVLETFHFDNELRDPRYTKGLIDQQGELWLASTRGGLFRVNLENGESKHYVEELNSPFSSSLYTWIRDLHEDRFGQIWIRLARSFAIYFPKGDQFKVFPHHQSEEKTFRYLQNFAEAPNGEVWLASEDEGIGRSDKTNLNRGVVQKITTLNGMLSDDVKQIEFTDDGLLWILSNHGFSSFDLNTQQIINYPWDRGIPVTTSFLPLPGGELGMRLPEGGIAILDPQKLRKVRNKPLPYITKVRVRDEVKYDGGNRFDLRNLSVLKGREYLIFEFSALGYSNPKQFAYMLEGVDSDWVETQELRSTSYSNLSPGNYTFLFKARLAGDEWSEPKQLDVYLAPRWWESYWFRSLVLIFILLGAYLFYRWRLESVKRNLKMKADFQHKLDEVEMQALRSQMNPHFLFNSLNSIQLYIIKNKREEAVNYLERFSRLMRLILQNSRSKLVPLKDELEALQLYMEFENLRFKVKFDWEIEVDPGINPNNVEIAPMLLQPFVENAIWHGISPKESKGKISVKVTQNHDHLVCSILDNGIGRRQSRKLKENSIRRHKSMGMKITQDRIDIINQSNNVHASLEIKDHEDAEQGPQGTEVLLRYPL